MGLTPIPDGDLPPMTSQHFVHFTTPEGLTAYTLTGVAQITFRGENTGLDFLRTTVTFAVPLPDLPDETGLRLVHWAPFVTLQSISNDDVAVNAGWAVDDFRLIGTDRVSNFVYVEANIAVRDVDGYILRLGYHITLLGSLEFMSTRSH